MRGLYITTYDTNDTYSGVCKKIKSQAQVFLDEGMDLEMIDANSISFVQTNVFGDILRALRGINNINLLRIFIVVEKKLKEKQYDFIYVRRSLIDGRCVKFYKEIKAKYPQIKMLFELPTYPYDNEIRLSQRINLFNDKKVRNHMPEFADRIVTYSNDAEIFGVKTLNISNGIDYSKYKQRTPLAHSGINVVAVALFERWHGYDRFLDGMFRQPDVVRLNNIHLYLGGKGRVLSEYREEVSKHGLEDYVHFLGEIHNEKLDELYNKADIALDCMGRHRVGCYYNSSLKGKEYCAYGVPIISGVKTELDSKSDFNYYLRVPADDSILDMNDVVAFYHRCYDCKSPIDLASEIRECSFKWFNIAQAFKPVVDFVKSK